MATKGEGREGCLKIRNFLFPKCYLGVVDERSFYFLKKYLFGVCTVLLQGGEVHLDKSQEELWAVNVSHLKGPKLQMCHSKKRDVPTSTGSKKGGWEGKRNASFVEHFFLRICCQSAAGFFERESAKTSKKVASKRRRLRENNSSRKQLPTKKDGEICQILWEILWVFLLLSIPVLVDSRTEA